MLVFCAFSHTRNGLKHLFRCNLVKYRGEDCEANIYTIKQKQLDGTDIIELYRQRMHTLTSETSDNKVVSLSEKVKALIDDLIVKGYTVRSICHELRRSEQMEGEVQPEKKDVTNYYRSAHGRLFGKPKVSVKDSHDFCEQNSQVPDDIDKAFVLAYEHSPLLENPEANADFAEDASIFEVIDQNAGDDPSKVEEAEDYSPRVPWIRYIVTTRRLLQMSSKSKVI